MSIVSMQKLSLIGLLDEKDRLLKALSHTRTTEIAFTENVENTTQCDTAPETEPLQSKLARISSALLQYREFKKIALRYNRASEKEVKVYEKKSKKLTSEEELTALQSTALVLADSPDATQLQLFTPVKTSPFAPAKLISFGEFEAVDTAIPTAEAAMDALEEATRQINAANVEIAKNDSLISQLIPYSDVDATFDSFTATKNTVAFLGLAATSAVSVFIEAASRIDTCFYQLYERGSVTVLAVICHTKDEADVSALLTEIEFSKCPFTFALTAREKIKELRTYNKFLSQEARDKAFDYAGQTDNIVLLQWLYDYYTLEIRKKEAAGRCRCTSRTFLMTAWTPTDKVQRVTDALEECGCVLDYAFSEPTQSDTPPTITKNDAFSTQFAGITNMFGTPGYREIDPNPFVAIFYFMFFGIMISDAGYGLVMAIACFTLVKLLKPTRKSTAMLTMFGLCGVSTILWGALFGGWFAIENIGFLQKLCWFNPLDEPLKMFMLSLGCGVVQISTGFAIKGAQHIKDGHALYGILNSFSWVVIFIGLLFISPTLMIFLGVIDTEAAWFGTCTKIGTYTALVGAAMLIAGGWVGKKSPLKMVTGSLSNLYGGISVVSDLLSYSRLFGLGLATGVVGYVMNMLGDIIVNTLCGGGWWAWFIAAPVVILCHTFNLAINLLGAYVHNSRLQYIEFFGRFYEGAGHAFFPLGDRLKYTHIE